MVTDDNAKCKAMQRNARAQTDKSAMIGSSIMTAIHLGWRGQGRMMKAMW